MNTYKLENCDSCKITFDKYNDPCIDCEKNPTRKVDNYEPNIIMLDENDFKLDYLNLHLAKNWSWTLKPIKNQNNCYYLIIDFKFMKLVKDINIPDGKWIMEKFRMIANKYNLPINCAELENERK